MADTVVLIYCIIAMSLAIANRLWQSTLKWLQNIIAMKHVQYSVVKLETGRKQ